MRRSGKKMRKKNNKFLGSLAYPTPPVIGLTVTVTPLLIHVTAGEERC